MRKLFAKKDKEIAKQMKIEEEKQNKTIRILVLGPKNCGKTTLVKQMKRLHKTYDGTDYKSKTTSIKSSVVSYIQTLCTQSTILHQKYNHNTSVDEKLDVIHNELLELKPPYEVTEDIGAKIKTVWSDSGIQETFQKRHLFSIHNNADYFLNKIDIISSPDYVATFDDFLRIHCANPGLSHNNITMDIDTEGEHFFEVTDIGGQKSQITKWLKIIQDDVHAVLYVTSLFDYEYDTKVDSDEKINPLIEAINLFQTVAKSNKKKFFEKKSVYVLFNKFSAFKEKIKDTAITVAFDDFPRDKMNPNDENDVVRFVGGKFLQILEDEAIHLNEPLHILRTDSLDNDNVKKIFSEIAVNLINKVLMK